MVLASAVGGTAVAVATVANSLNGKYEVYSYPTRAIITRSRFETALDYKPRILRLRKVLL